jgi:hypothetical protein
MRRQMSHRHTHSNVLRAIDAEIGLLEQRLRKLHEIRSLTTELDDAQPPAAATPKRAPAIPRRKSRQSKRQSPLAVADVVKVARQVLASGPATIGTILTATGRTRSPHGVRVTEAALQQLGAAPVGKVRGGGTAYALQPDRSDEPKQATAPQRATQPGGLKEAIAELARTAVGWNDEEFQYQLRKRCGIEASVTDVHRARVDLDGAAGRR